MPNRLKKEDYIGKKYGMLLVQDVFICEKSWTKCICLCECGKNKEVYPNNLKSGKVKSCGCLKENQGLSYPKEYRTWRGMRDRCKNKKAPSYKNYGGRGIQVCPEWDKSFIKFLEDMGPRPSDKHSIERIDNDGNYEPNNCRWATSKEQNLNKRNTIFINISGEKKPLSEWAEYVNVSYYRLKRRIKDKECKPEEILENIKNEVEVRSHGGMRTGSGRPSGWNLGKTKAVKLPISILDEIIRYARHLDNGGKPFDSD